MRKFSKILALLLAACLIGSVFALTTSADASSATLRLSGDGVKAGTTDTNFYCNDYSGGKAGKYFNTSSSSDNEASLYLYGSANYLLPEYDMYPNGKTSYIMYSQCYAIDLKDDFAGQTVIKRNDSYFNRTAEHFCSHYHTPYDRAKTDVGAIVTENAGYIAWDIFTEYAEHGSVHLKYAVIDMIDRLLGEDKSANTSLPSGGIFSLMKQPYENKERLVCQLAYAIPKVRGRNTEIIEDIPPLHDVKVTLKSDKSPTRVYLAPSEEELKFEYENGNLTYTVPKIDCSAMVVIE